MHKRRRHLIQDLFLIAASLLLAWAIVHYHLVEALLAWSGDGVLLTSFIAGIFFTSLVTTAPALAVLGELTLHSDPIMVALVGAAGAVIGDSLIFFFIRDRVSEDVSYLMLHTKTPKLFKKLQGRKLRWVLPVIGGLIIASPFPDELGLALMGVAKVQAGRFIAISYAFNAVGILLIALAARALA